MSLDNKAKTSLEKQKYVNMLKFMNQEATEKSAEVDKKNAEIRSLTVLNKEIEEMRKQDKTTAEKEINRLKEKLEKAVKERDVLGEKLADKLNEWNEQLEKVEEERDMLMEKLELTEKAEMEISKAKEKAKNEISILRDAMAKEKEVRMNKFKVKVERKLEGMNASKFIKDEIKIFVFIKIRIYK